MLARTDYRVRRRALRGAAQPIRSGTDPEYSLTHLIAHGTTVLGGHAASRTADPQGLTGEFQQVPDGVDAIQHAGTRVARVSADHVPTPPSNALATSNPGFTGFDGITHRDQRLAGTYANTQFSLEPPDQAMCVGNGFLLESVNDALQVFQPDGTPVSGTLVALSQFLGLTPEIIRPAPFVYGDGISDPKCYFDTATNRWFLTELKWTTDPMSGAPTGPSAIELAVSSSGDLPGSWHVYSLNTIDDGTGGTPRHPNCPCFGDQPLIGADANGLYISTNEYFNTTLYFGNGAQIYAMSKWALASGTMPTVVHINAGIMAHPNVGGFWWKVQPAITAPGAADAPNTEYFISAVDALASQDNRLAVFSLTGTDTLLSPTPNLTLADTVLPSEELAVTFTSGGSTCGSWCCFLEGY